MAQKKLVPVTQSELTGMNLPAGTKKDSRFLFESSAKALLEFESKKSGVGVNRIEVLSLPPTSASGFNADSLVSQLSSLGWNITPIEGDNKYAWLQKENRFMIIYFEMEKKSTELYVGEVAGTPSNAINPNNPTTLQVNPDASGQQTVQQTGQQPIQQNGQQPVHQTVTQTPGQTISQPSNNTGFAFYITNFDDGWTSTIYDDYILVTKNNIKVYVSLMEKFDGSQFSGTGIEARHYYWDNYVSKYFITGEKVFDNGGVLSEYSQDYIEGWATDKQTGEKRYVGMILSISPSSVSIIVATAPDREQLRQQFPNADKKYPNDLLGMYSYNKFAVAKNDIVGTWVSGGNGAMITWYSTTTGNNVGSTAVSKSDVFRFGADDNYTSTHNGASGWVGAMNTYQQEYKGNYSVTEWSVTATKRWDGKAETFSAWFEVIRGGRILHLDGSIGVNLFKEK